MQVARSAVHSAPNVTPMIDVMLVLLIIFMLVAPVVDAGATARPPVAEHAPPHPSEQAVTITINRAGRLFVNRRPVAAAALEAAVRAALAAARDRTLYLRADRDAEYGAIRDAMDAARRAGAPTIGLITEREGVRR